MYATQIHYNRSIIYSAWLWKFDHNGVDWYLIQWFSMGYLMQVNMWFKIWCTTVLDYMNNFGTSENSCTEGLFPTIAV